MESFEEFKQGNVELVDAALGALKRAPFSESIREPVNDLATLLPQLKATRSHDEWCVVAEKFFPVWESLDRTLRRRFDAGIHFFVDMYG